MLPLRLDAGVKSLHAQDRSEALAAGAAGSTDLGVLILFACARRDYFTASVAPILQNG
jgi:hypothetical protein